MSLELLTDTVRALREQPEDVELEATGGLTLDVPASTPRPASTTSASAG